MKVTNEIRVYQNDFNLNNERKCCDLNYDYSENLIKTQKRFKLGFANTSDLSKEDFTPIPISFIPWTLSKSDYSEAVETAQALSKILEQLSFQRDYLLELFEDFKDESSLIFKLKNLIQTSHLQQNNLATNLNLSRFDFLVDSERQWKLVESNTIAAGMGPFSEKLGEFHKELFPNQKYKLAENPAIERQAIAMFKAAATKAKAASPNIVFVTEENEDNIYDQNYLIAELRSLGAMVQRKTLRELKTGLTRSKQKLLLDQLGQVDLFYFRTGYNLQDYSAASHNSIKSQTELLELRSWIEKHDVAVSPSISHQLASSKWVQIKLSNLALKELKNRFGLSNYEAELASKSLKTKYMTVESLAQTKQALDSGKWILKNQNEGGGNVREKISYRERFDKLKRNTFLMRKIVSPIRRNGCRYYESNFKCNFQTISELGIFIVGESHEYAGYLARSKPASKLEGGVHSGDGFLDLVAIE